MLAFQAGRQPVQLFQPQTRESWTGDHTFIGRMFMDMVAGRSELDVLSVV